MNNFNTAQKILFIIGVNSLIIFLVAGFISDDWIIGEDFRFDNFSLRFVSEGWEIYWLTFVPLLVFLSTIVGLFLFKDK